ncbi:hypothetical protein [Vagococcus fluvialis]|uniref:hypothetical protein n=1 Tax=Vagococcus fluvialis TaxID=2738 RepID=UPI003D10959F
MNTEKIESKIRKLQQLKNELEEIDLLILEMNRVEKEVEDGAEPYCLFGIAFSNTKLKFREKSERRFALNGVTSYPETTIGVIALVRSATEKRRKEIEKIINENYGGLEND